jgi:putative N6-adenine-specific DNA methylase
VTHEVSIAHKSNIPLEIFAVAAPGLEKILARELDDLGISGAEIVEGGVSFRGNLSQLYETNLASRVASRVIVRIARFHADSFHELERRAKKIPWNEYLAPDASVRFRVTCRKSRLYHSDAVAQRFVDAVRARVGDVSVGDGGDEEDSRDADSAQLFIVRITHDECVVSADSSGALLHRRGYRLATGKAPLRETLAAAMVLASGWDPSRPLVDPMCGSGTIAIEAALLARGIPPGINRAFAFQHWPSYRNEVWERLVTKSGKPGTIGAILASDRDDGVVKTAIENACRAGVQNDIQFERKAVSAILPPQPAGWVITNPPYGARVGEPGPLRNLYAQLGKTLQSKAPGYTLALLSADRKLEAALTIPLETEFRTTNGGIPVKLMRGIIPFRAVPLLNTVNPL